MGHGAPANKATSLPTAELAKRRNVASNVTQHLREALESRLQRIGRDNQLI
jgi:hypothetical protein